MKRKAGSVRTFPGAEGGGLTASLGGLEMKTLRGPPCTTAYRACRAATLLDSLAKQVEVTLFTPLTLQRTCPHWWSPRSPVVTCQTLRSPDNLPLGSYSYPAASEEDKSECFSSMTGKMSLVIWKTGRKGVIMGIPEEPRPNKSQTGPFLNRTS